MTIIEWADWVLEELRKRLAESPARETVKFRAEKIVEILEKAPFQRIQ